jgi:hypothetical protein
MNEELFNILQAQSEEMRSFISKGAGSYNHRFDHLISGSGSEVIHEYIHFFDHIGTPYGFFLDSMTCLQIESVKRLYFYFGQDDSPHLPTPMFDKIKELENDENSNLLQQYLIEFSGPNYDFLSCHNFLALYFHVWSITTWLNTALETPKKIIDSSVCSYIPGMLAIFELLDEYGIPKDINEYIALCENLEKWEWDGSIGQEVEVPTLISETPIVTGAVDLMEARAFSIDRISMEMHQLINDNQFESFMKKLVRDKKEEYYMAPIIVHEHLSKYGPIQFHESLKTFNIVADLALYSPVGKLYSEFRMENHWSEVSPAHRYVYLVGLLSEVGPHEEGRDVFEYQIELSDKAGFVSPKEFLIKGSMLKASNYREQRHQQACKFKIDVPRLFIYHLLPDHDWPEIDITDFIGYWCPFESTPSSERKTPVPKMDADMIFNRIIDNINLNFGLEGLYKKIDKNYDFINAGYNFKLLFSETDYNKLKELVKRNLIDRINL